MGYSDEPPGPLVDLLAEYESVVEIGIGRRTALAGSLVERGVTVTATDIHHRTVPDGVSFVRDDIVQPDLSFYRESEAIYARNLPPELHRPTLDVVRAVESDFLFTTLGGDQPVIPVERRTVEHESGCSVVFVAAYDSNR